MTGALPGEETGDQARAGGPGIQRCPPGAAGPAARRAPDQERERLVRGRTAVGFSLSPDPTFIQRCAPVFAAVDYLEVLPESLVTPRDNAAFTPNGFFRRAADLQQRLGVPLVAHGSGLSVGTAHPVDGARHQRWLERARALGERLGFPWYTDHAGVTAPGGLNLTLPMDFPHSKGLRDASRKRLTALADAVGVPVGIENSVMYAPFADPADEPAWLHGLLGDQHVWLLDVHNLWTHARNFGIDVEAWLHRAPLDRVIEIHVSGGVDADPRWTEGRSWHLDSHDSPVPEPVWDLLTAVLPRCANVRGVTLERLEGTVNDEDLPGLLSEVARIRAILSATQPHPDPPRPGPADPPEADAAHLELRLADAWCARDPLDALRRISQDPDELAWVREAVGWAVRHPVGVAITRRLVFRQRFERLVNGSAEANAWFEHDPAGFARAFLTYATSVPPVAFLPGDEARLWAG